MPVLKIQSFNVNGFRAICKKMVDGSLCLKDWIIKERPDILGLQETKVWAEQLSQEDLQLEGYSPLELSKPHRKGYSGVGLYRKDSVEGKISQDFFHNALDQEGRVNYLQAEKFDLLNVYFPNGGGSKERLEYKMDFYRQFLKRCQTLLKNGKEVIVMGDVNTAHQDIDLTHPKENEKSSGFLPMERVWIDDFLKIGFIDTYRYFYPQQEQSYTWWDMKTRARERNVGWRIDYILVSRGLVKNLQSARILSDIQGSDHCPIEIELSV